MAGGTVNIKQEVKMPFTYSKYIGYHETAPANKVEVEAFSDRGAKMKINKTLSEQRLIPRRKGLDKIKIERV